jgi:transposase
VPVLAGQWSPTSLIHYDTYLEGNGDTVARRPGYSPELREEAARMVVESSRPIAEVAREVKVNEATLGRWVKAYYRARIRELKGEKRELTMQLASLTERQIQDGTASFKAEAVERARNSIRLADGAADDLIAGTMASADPGWVPFGEGLLFPLLLLPLGLISGTAYWVAVAVMFVVFSFMAGVFSVAVLPRLRRPVYLVLTPGEFACYRVPKISRPPAGAELWFRAPPSAIRIAGRRAKADPTWTISVSSHSPGRKRRPRPLRVDGAWTRELYEVVTALHACGAKVQPALLAPPAL